MYGADDKNGSGALQVCGRRLMGRQVAGAKRADVGLQNIGALTGCPEPTADPVANPLVGGKREKFTG